MVGIFPSCQSQDQIQPPPQSCPWDNAPPQWWHITMSSLDYLLYSGSAKHAMTAELQNWDSPIHLWQILKTSTVSLFSARILWSRISNNSTKLFSVPNQLIIIINSANHFSVDNSANHIQTRNIGERLTDTRKLLPITSLSQKPKKHHDMRSSVRSNQRKKVLKCVSFLNNPKNDLFGS